MTVRLTRGMRAAGSVAVVLAAALLTGTTPATAASTAVTAKPAAAPSHPDADFMGSTIPDSERAAAPKTQARAMAAAAAAPSGTPGVDVSHYQGNVDWAGMASGGNKFAYMKATESTTYTDPMFATNYAGSANAGLKRGAYHFGLPDTSSGAAQADYFMAHGGGWANDGKTLPPVLDIEFNPYSTKDWPGYCYNETPAQINGWITDFVNRVHDRTNRWPVIYTTTNWWSHCTGNSGSINQNTPLWIAGDPSTLPAGWGSYTFYQYDIVDNVDQDVYNGTTDALNALPAGSTQDKIADHYAALGGAGGTLGAANGGVYSIAGGWAQNFANGVIYYTPGTGAWALQGPILTKFQQLGGPAVVGFPTQDSSPCSDGTGQFDHFSNWSSIFYSPANGAHLVKGLIRDKWASMGYERSVLGYPTNDEDGTPDGIGRFNHFAKGGSIYFTPSTGAHAVYGLIRQKWADTGWERGPLGYPANDEDGTPDGIGRFNHFSKGGSIYYTPSTGAHWINGMIKSRWAALGWERSYLHYPTSDEYTITNGWRNDFQGGYIYFISGASAAVDRPW